MSNRIPNFGWNRLKLATLTYEQLAQLEEQVKAEHSCKNGIHLFDKAGQRKLDALSWAVYNKQKAQQRIAALDSRTVTVKLPDELSGETLLDVSSRTDLVYSDDTGVLEYTNINGCFVKITAPPDKVIRFRCSNEGTYIRLVDRVKTHEHAGIIVDFPKNL